VDNSADGLVKSVSLSKQKIKDLSKLSLKKYRQQLGQVLVEGMNTIDQLVVNGIMPLELYYSQHYGLVERLATIPAFEVRQDELNRICMTKTPQSLAALYAVPKLEGRTFQRAFYLDGISDPGNMGSIFRIASAFGFDAIILSPQCCDPFSPKVIRASLGSVFWLAGMEEKAQWLAEQEARVFCLDMHAEQSLHELMIAAISRIVVVIGSEAHGLSADVKAMPFERVRIIMQPDMESLNAAVAAGIVAHHLYTQLHHDK